MDKTEFERCRSLVRQVELMGTQVSNHGLNAGVVSTLVDLVDDLSGMNFYGSLESAIAGIHNE